MVLKLKKKLEKSEKLRMVVGRNNLSKSKLNILSWLMGIGLILFVAHVKLGRLDAFIFLPWIGMALIVVAVVSVLNSKEKIEIGEKKIWIPMAIISVSIAISGIWAYAEHRRSFNEMVATLFIGVFIFSIYLASKQLGKGIFKSLSIASMIEAVSIPIWAAYHHWYPNGGLISETNYDIATGVVILGILVSPKKNWWWMATIGSIGLLFSGSGEAMLSGVILLIVTLFSKVTWWQIAIPVSSLAVIGFVAVVSGTFTSYQAPNMQRLATIGVLYHLPPSQSFWQNEKNKADSIVSTPPDAKVIDEILGYRITHFQISPIKPFGYGINLTNFYWGIPHNVFLIIIEQAGILALLAWCWLIGLGIKQMTTRVLFIGFLSLGMVDHYIWTQWAVAFPALIGTYISERGIIAKDN